MTGLDICILVGYLIGLLVLGGILSKKIVTSVDMFAAGEQSPWWVAGISGFMTMFSSGTFVVWGGIAYRSGLVAVTILMTLGISALLVGYFLAARWKHTGATTVSEYIELRYGMVAVQVYSWLGMTFRMVGVGVALYSISVMLAALVPLSETNPLCDANTGHLAVPWTIVLSGVVVVGYTVAGGLWAVLLTDVLQFIVLTAAVLIVIPLVMIEAGGVNRIIASAPQGFFWPVSSEFTWLFMGGWIIVHAFKIGGEWAFVQRFLCVPNENDAKKSAYLFGALYLISPVVWMLPPMVYKVIDPAANPEQAYILACQMALPAGMMGLMLAAMFSATASMADSEINVFAGAFTRDIYRKIFKPDASETHLVAVGRVLTTVLGAVVIAIAIAIPHLGGAEEVILSITGQFVVPMVLPAIWGLFSKRVGSSCIWASMAAGFAAGGIVKFGLAKGGWFCCVGWLAGLAELIQANPRVSEVGAGILVPVAALAIMELLARGENQGWNSLSNHAAEHKAARATIASSLPQVVLAWSVAALGLVTLLIGVSQSDGKVVLITFSASMFAVSGGMLCFIRWRQSD